MGNTGNLDRSLKNFITENTRELASVEGNLLGAAKGKEIKTIFVTSCHPGEGKTTAAVSMAYSLVTEAHARVLLIDANPHAPKIHDHFGVGISPGFSDFVLSDAQHASFICKTEYDRLHIIPSGSSSIKKSDMLDSGTFKSRLDAVKLDYNYIIFDGHSVFGASEVSHIAKHCDGILFVVECERTKWEVLQEAKDKISNIGGNIIGAILNKRKYYIPRKIYGKV